MSGARAWVGFFLAALAALGCARSKAPPAGSFTPAPSGVVPSTLAPNPALPVPPGQAVSSGHGLELDRIKLPRGFRIEPFATDVENARSLALSPSGTLFVGSRSAGSVYAIPNADHDARGDRVITLARNLETPNGVAFRNGALYVAEISRVLRFDDIEARLDQPPKPVVLYDGYPTDGHHGWKFAAFGPDGFMYVPVGAPCNVCDEKDPRYGSITRLDLENKSVEVFARGIRNSVGFDWHPRTHELWFTDNGADRMGDHVPPDELNRAPKSGLHFGFPYCHGKDIADSEYGKKKRCKDTTPPVQLLGPHVAALGMRFYTGKQFPSEYHGQIFIAEHGSWNRSAKIGYRVTLVRLKDDQPASYEVFAQGWLVNEDPWGRPVDLLVMPDGALLVSDDEAHAIYRISYIG
jgi:glucose/arabinose dehydrogenase